MKYKASDVDVQNVQDEITKLGYIPRPAPGETRVVIGVMGNKPLRGRQHLEALEGVEKVLLVSTPYKLVSREWKNSDTIVRVGNVHIGGNFVTVIGGPCAIESYEQTLAAAIGVKEAGGHILRGGAFKPRTSPYSFQGLGEEGLEILQRVGKEVGLPVVTEVVDHVNVSLVDNYCDMLQIGTRNMQNFELLKAAGRSKKPVLLKRGQSSTVEETLLAAEYILNEGNEQVVLCERGIRTFVDHSRNTLDISAIPAFQRLTHLPVIVDPAHAAGKRYMVAPLALGGIAAGAQGVIVEVHPNPAIAKSDGPQQLVPEDFKKLMISIEQVAKAVGKTMA
jgi:3-deoxy-7-phosphoheptulonate synthase